MSTAPTIKDEIHNRIATANWAFGALPDNALLDSEYLDVGFGSGNALIAAALKGARKISGIDIDFQQQSQATETYVPPFANFWKLASNAGFEDSKFQLIDGDFLTHNFKGTLFDIVSLIDVVEHLNDPIASIKKCASLLQPNGFLLIAGGGFYYSNQGHHLWHWWPPETMSWRHLWKDFTNDSQERIRNETGVADWYWAEFKRLNRVTVSQVRNACREAGLREVSFTPLVAGGAEIERVAEKIDMSHVPALEDLFLAGLVLVCSRN